MTSQQQVVSSLFRNVDACIKNACRAALQGCDICTFADMKYLLIAAMRGDVLSQTTLRDPEVRGQTLQSAVQHYTRCYKVA